MSASSDVRAEFERIDENPIREIRRIQRNLSAGDYVFEPARGHTKRKKSGGRRAIVVAGLTDRIIQRAILNVLQSETPRIRRRLGKIPNVLSTPTSVGGVPGQSVAAGIALVCAEIRDGAKVFVRSDICEFFTRVPKSRVAAFVEANIDDDEFVQLFSLALHTELANPDELKGWLHLFPLDDTGVAQGSSLSAFAANVVLEQFDQVMNAGGVRTVRYIDDFVVLARNEAQLKEKIHCGRSLLIDLDMDCYQPGDGTGKAAQGDVADGFDFLGCHVHPSNVSPSRAAQASLIGDVRTVIRDARFAIDRFSKASERRRAEAAYTQTIALIDCKVRGWGDAFSFATNRLPFAQLDQQLDRILGEFRNWHARRCKTASPKERRRMTGVALLADTPPRVPETEQSTGN